MNNLWYQNLIQPDFLPEPEIFPIVWGALYFLIFMSLIAYGLADSDNKKIGYLFFTIQIIFNFLWSPIFFGMQNIPLAFVILCLMAIFLVLTVVTFFKISKISAILLLPYVFWAGCAIYLNFEFMRLNCF